MFGRRRRGWGGGGGGSLGLFLLFFQLINFVQFLTARNEFLPVTLGVLGLNVVAFLRPNVGRIHWPSVSSGCISLQKVYYQKQWDRIILAPFLHADSFHLYYNMASFMWKARTLEGHYGSGYFAYMVAVFSVLTSLVYLVLNWAIAEMFDTWSYVTTCAVGFSGVIFALKVLTTHLTPSGTSFMMGIPIPSRLAVWAELVLISVLFPRASFVGHLAGILVGVAFVSGPLKQIMDLPVGLLEGQIGGLGSSFTGRQSYTYAARTSGYRGGERDGGDHTRGPVRQEVPSSQQGERQRRDRESSEERQLQQAIEASLQEERRRNLEEERRGGNKGTERPPPYNPDFDPFEESSNPRYQWQDRNHQESGEEEEEEVEEELTRRRLRELRLRRFTGQGK